MRIVRTLLAAALILPLFTSLASAQVRYPPRAYEPLDPQVRNTYDKCEARDNKACKLILAGIIVVHMDYRDRCKKTGNAEICAQADAVTAAVRRVLEIVHNVYD